MNCIYFESASKFDSFDVSSVIKTLLFNVLVAIELHCSLLTVCYHKVFEVCVIITIFKNFPIKSYWRSNLEAN